MITRKVTTKTDNNKLQEFISALESDWYTADCPEAQIITSTKSLSLYFSNLHSHITSQNLLSLKRYQILNQGLYILLRGQISYMYSGSATEREKEMIRTKSSHNKNSSGITMISAPFSVFECSFKNCTAVQQSYLLKIQEEQAISCKFYQLYNRRVQLYQHQFLPFDHPLSNTIDHFGSVFSVDMKIHSNFKFKRYSFRQVAMLRSIGIIAEGRMRMKTQQGVLKGSHQIQRYGVLLPNMLYEATSAFVDVMHVQDNQTLILKINEECMNEATSKSQHWPSFKENRPHKKDKKSTLEDIKIMFTQKERVKRDRHLTKLSKQSEHYSIVSTFICHKSLDLIKKQSTAARYKEKREDRCKHPLILFNIVNEKSRLATPNFANATTTPVLREETPNLSRWRINKITSEVNSNSNKAILKKLKVPLKEYERMVRRRELLQDEPVRDQTKAKSLFTLTAGKHTFDSSHESSQFVRYENL